MKLLILNQGTCTMNKSVYVLAINKILYTYIVPLHRPKHLTKVHVWAGISKRGRTSVCIFEAIFNEKGNVCEHLGWDSALLH